MTADTTICGAEGEIAADPTLGALPPETVTLPNSVQSTMRGDERQLVRDPTSGLAHVRLGARERDLLWRAPPASTPFAENGIATSKALTILGTTKSETEANRRAVNKLVRIGLLDTQYERRGKNGARPIIREDGWRIYFGRWNGFMVVIRRTPLGDDVVRRVNAWRRGRSGTCTHRIRWAEVFAGGGVDEGGAL